MIHCPEKNRVCNAREREMSHGTKTSSIPIMLGLHAPLTETAIRDGQSKHEAMEENQELETG